MKDIDVDKLIEGLFYNQLPVKVVFVLSEQLWENKICNGYFLNEDLSNIYSEIEIEEIKEKCRKRNKCQCMACIILHTERMANKEVNNE